MVDNHLFNELWNEPQTSHDNISAKQREIMNQNAGLLCYNITCRSPIHLTFSRKHWTQLQTNTAKKREKMRPPSILSFEIRLPIHSHAPALHNKAITHFSHAEGLDQLLRFFFLFAVSTWLQTYGRHMASFVCSNGLHAWWKKTPHALKQNLLHRKDEEALEDKKRWCTN